MSESVTSDSLFDDDVDEQVLLAADSVESAQDQKSMSEAQRARADRNRQKALALKHARLTARPYPDTKRYVDPLENEKSKSVQQQKKMIDTNAGFFIEADPDGENEAEELEVERDPAPVIEPDRPTCLECKKELADSYLLRSFDYEVCDKCKDTEKDGKHELITRTDAKNIFLLKDVDFDRREPVLKFILKKNPHNPRWGDMKLYLRVQIEERALQVWGSEEALEAEHEKREIKKDKAKSKKFAKKMKVLRMQVRGSLYKRDVAGSGAHTHEFGAESYDEETDTYSKTCKSCGHVQEYEKM